MEVIGVIPSRYASTRLPGKPLCDIGGKTMIQRVYERAKRARKLDRVMVATDDERIKDAVLAFGGEAVMTSKDHPNGTSRVQEAIKGIGCSAVVGIQGDEPFMDPALIDQVAECLLENPKVPMVTLRYPLPEEDWDNPNRVKVVVDKEDRALYFSRYPIPYRRNPGCPVFGHIGIYGYQRKFLDLYVSMEDTPLSNSESLEQLRVLEWGYEILAPEAKGTHVFGIDTEEDLDRARLFLKENGL